MIPDYYLRGRGGFEGLEGVQRLYGVDVMALVSHDQVVHTDENNWSLGYRKNRAERPAGGGGALSWPFILVLLALITFRRSVRLERMAP